MKKKYMTPMSQTVEMETECLIAASGVISGSGSDIHINGPSDNLEEDSFGSTSFAAENENYWE